MLFVERVRFDVVMGTIQASCLIMKIDRMMMS